MSKQINPETNKSIAKAFALAVPASLLAKTIDRVGKADEGEVENERERFYRWLLARFNRFGIVFSNQRDAWDYYNSVGVLDEYKEPEEKDGKKFYLGSVYGAWEIQFVRQLEDLALSLAGNYSEYGGQL